MRANRRRFRLTPPDFQKRRAREIAHYRHSIGELVAQPCESCGAWDVEMHHTDYSKPLEIEWLCTTCHLAEHGKIHHLAAVSCP